MRRIKVLLEEPIVPDKMFFEGKKYIISDVSKDFVTRSYCLYIDDKGRVQKLSLSNKHPNCDPVTGLFCLPRFVKQEVFSDKIKSMIHCWLGTFNLENCYYMPWGQCKYKRM